LVINLSADEQQDQTMFIKDDYSVMFMMATFILKMQHHYQSAHILMNAHDITVLTRARGSRNLFLLEQHV